MSEDDQRVIDEMTRSGGSFVKALAEAFRRADGINFAKLRTTFDEYWSVYARLAGTDPTHALIDNTSLVGTDPWHKKNV